jgi:hypothetical protein
MTEMFCGLYFMCIQSKKGKHTKVAIHINWPWSLKVYLFDPQERVSNVKIHGEKI